MEARHVPLEPPATDDPDEKAWAELTQTQFVIGYADADGIYDAPE